LIQGIAFIIFNYTTLKGDDMARPSKIEKHGLQDKVIELPRNTIFLHGKALV